MGRVKTMPGIGGVLQVSAITVFTGEIVGQVVLVSSERSVRGEIMFNSF
jgi:hypothetical protein